MSCLLMKYASINSISCAEICIKSAMIIAIIVARGLEKDSQREYTRFFDKPMVTWSMTAIRQSVFLSGQ